MQPLTKFVSEPPNTPDLGLGYIASSLNREGHDVHVMDWNMGYVEESLRGWLRENCPDLIGIKIFTKDVGAAKRTISLVRETLPDGIIVIGGPHPSAVDPLELMEDFAYCDFAIKGEAEISLPSLLSAVARSWENNKKGCLTKEMAVTVPGLVWRNKEKVFSNPIAFVYDLDNIDFPCWEMLDPNNYDVDMLGSAIKEGNTAPIITTRGCPGMCNFCSAFNVNGRIIRTRSPENVLKEMLLLYNKYDVNKFMFQDNCFTSIKENLIRLCELIIEEGMEIEWDCVSYERLDNLTDETLSLMYRAGCRMIHMGVESGSPNVRRVMNKSGSLEEITEKVRIIQRNSIKVCAFFMIGFPEETKQEMKKTIKYAFFLGAELVMFTICFPLPGTQVYSYIKEKYKFDRIDWANFDIYTSQYPISKLSSMELTRSLLSLPGKFKLQISSLIFFPGTELNKVAQKEGILKDELSEICRKPFTFQKGTYLNYLIYLSGFPVIPRHILNLLSNKKLVKLLHTQEPRKFYEFLFYITDKIRLLVKGIIALL